MAFLAAACTTGEAGTPLPVDRTATSPTPATTTSSPGSTPFTASVNDVITQINLQLPILVENGTPTSLPVTIGPDGTFGGPVTPTTEIRLIPQGNAFEPVAAVTVRTRATAGTLLTPARLLSGIGAALYSLSSDAVAAFGDDVLPRLSALDQTRTTITVGTFYDLTIVVIDASELTYTFTPIGVAAPV